MFYIETVRFGDLRAYRVVNCDTKQLFSIIPGFGTLINELALSKKGRTHQVIQGYSSYEDLAREFSTTYRGANLFPFTGVIKEGAYSFRGKSYSLSKNAPNHRNALHGYLYNRKFEIIRVETSAEKGILETQYKEDGSYLPYPFSFEISVEFELEKSGFRCTTRIENTGKDAMPIGQGWHPYFKAIRKTDEMLLQLPATEYLELDKDLCPTGVKKDLDKFREPEKIDRTSLDTVFTLEKKKGICKTYLFDPDRTMKIVLWQETGEKKYNYLTVYTPQKRDSIAMEPWTCPPDAFNNKMDLIILDPGEKLELAFGISLE